MELALIITGSVIAALLVIYLILIAPGKRGNIKEFTTVSYAHRGLHGEGIAENSISAFRAAVEAGYGIELDVRLSKDGKLVVFHDDTLDRVCGVRGRVDAFTAEELANMRLSGTEDGVPLFDDVLSLVDGKVPLLVEIKEDAGKYGVSTAAAERLATYGGRFIVESFNPLSLMNMKKRLPTALRGVLSQQFTRDKNYRKPMYFALQLLLLNRLASPAFVAYNHEHAGALSLRLFRALFRGTTFAWTTRSPEDHVKASKAFSACIFEYYLP